MKEDEKRALCVELLSLEIDWYDDDRGALKCPAAHLHTKPTGPKDTIIYLDGVPTMFCFHESCREVIQDANSILRQAIAPMTPEQKEENKVKRDRYHEIGSKARKVVCHREVILEKYAWPEIFADPSTPDAAWNSFCQLWNPDDIIWIGEVWDTGPVKGPGHFLTVREWNERGVNTYPNHFTTASTFKWGTIDRVGRQVERTDYIVVEFDSLNSDKELNRTWGAAMLKYCATFIDLAMVVDSGNKSLHGWFRNNEKVDSETRFFLRSIGADTKTMRPSQPVRLPGARRENGNIQSVLWIPRQ
jgi:hypothetical protein